MRRLAPLLVVACLATGAAIAQAAVSSGTYAGKFSDRGTVSLKVDKGQKLIKIRRAGLTFKCSDGDRFKSLKSTATGAVDVADRRFDIGDTTPDDGVDWQMKGKFSPTTTKVKGTYSETRIFNDQNQLDPNGSVVCKTADLTYSAALPKKR
jgi:hypothetical protein